MNPEAACSPAWSPTPEIIQASNVEWLRQQVAAPSFEALHAWSVRHRADYWDLTARRLGLILRRPPDQVLDVSAGPAHARWFAGARLNIADSCFSHDPAAPAVLHQDEDGPLRVMTLGELDSLSGRVAAGLKARGVGPGDAVGLVLPLTADAVAAYLGVVRAGAVAVGIPDSFSPGEIAVRLRLGGARLVLTQDALLRGGKRHDLYARVAAVGDVAAVVLPGRDRLDASLRPGDVAWADFLAAAPAGPAVERGPDDAMNVLFSSGTTREPKAIPWTHLTPLKCAADAHFHHDVHPGDVLCWPTSLGWMMGPWLIFAALMNRAALAVYTGSPITRGFGEFVARARVSLLGLVPSLVAAWRASGCLEGLDWSGLRSFGSTGECSNPDDMRWLMAVPGGRPVIEYCGGTEVAGGYITGFVTLPCVPSAFNTPALGLDVIILDPAGQPADKGEAFLVPPSVGLSNRLLNADHEAVYYRGCPAGSGIPGGVVLRRHGDEMERLPGGYWRARGRADDAMNLGGIKIAAAEVEAAVAGVEGVREVAAVAVPPPGGGPDRLVVFVVLADGLPDHPAANLKAAMQTALRRDLNPLFHIHAVEVVDALPRTASHKVMRRLLRDRGRAAAGDNP